MRSPTERFRITGPEGPTASAELPGTGEVRMVGPVRWQAKSDAKADAAESQRLAAKTADADERYATLLSGEDGCS